MIRVAVVIAAVCLASPVWAAQAIPQTVTAAVAADRPAEDRQRDAVRRPAEVLAFSGVQPGWKVGEYMPGAGYFTRILARVVGDDGWVLAYQPAEIVRMRPAFLTEIQAVAAEPGMGNVRVASDATGAFAAPEPLDLVFTAQNFHDLYGPFAGPTTGDQFLSAVHAALKPGGFLLVIDHHATADSGLGGAGALHRIDAEATRARIEAAGFVLEADSDLLANPDDTRALSVFDPAIRGRTDQFMMRFRKVE